MLLNEKEVFFSDKKAKKSDEIIPQIKSVQYPAAFRNFG